MRQTSKPKRRVGFRYQRKRRRFWRLIRKVSRNYIREFGDTVPPIPQPWLELKPDEVWTVVSVEVPE